MIKSNNFYLDAHASALVYELREQAVEHEVICRQAPVIWDAEYVGDARLAKDGCLGITTGTKCPLIELCIETAIACDIKAGVWGGLTPTEIHRLRIERGLL